MPHLAYVNCPGTTDIEWKKAKVESENLIDDKTKQTLDRLHRKLQVVDEDKNDKAVNDLEFFYQEGHVLHLPP